ncbi:lysophosphatidic acid receptor 6-like isoform X1 [Oreochromis aureus]|uniref:lysophosphatidic acid receptor 6-like isoform X1 n=1 Tax=Oreochromis aureus TaxID=47969 RepID=UPI001953991C|nr:lysophosphatidic acid receptor 6-like isoform X1 [Oreochromis aureus]XP_039478274.1 lysophosphatidic acid receptor 6-like isoform X1 [Oreochromis aureus]
MNASNVMTEDRVYAGVFGCIMVIGLPLNAASLWILLRRHSLKSPNAVFMVNLALSDLLVIISLPMRIYFHATREWPLSNMACLIITMLFRNNLRSSTFFITFISVDRLLAVVYPLRSRHLRTSSNAWKGAAMVWLFVLVLNVPETLDFLKNANHSSCFDFSPEWRPGLTKDIAFVYFVLIVTMLAVNIVCTVMVAWVLRRHLSDSAKINNKMNVMLIFVMNLVLFAICFLPLSIGVVTVKPTELKPLICLSAVNCCLDPFLYYFSFDGFWKKKEDADPAREQ